MQSQNVWTTEDSITATNYIRYTAEVFEKLKHNQQVRIAILGISENCAEPVYFATIDSIIEHIYISPQSFKLKDSIDYYLDDLGYSITYDTISDFFDRKSFYTKIYQNEEDYNNRVFDTTLVKFEPFVSILNKTAFNSTSFLWDVIPQIGFYSFEDSLPIESVSSESDVISEDMIWLQETPQFNWVFGYRFTPILGSFSKGNIIICSGGQLNNLPPCKECYPASSTAINGMSYTSNGSGLNSEVNIRQHITTNPPITAGCNAITPAFGVTPFKLGNTPVTYSDISWLSVNTSLPIYTLKGLNCINKWSIKKVQYGILDRLHVDLGGGNFQERLGNTMSMCADFTSMISGIGNCSGPQGYNQANRIHVENGFFRLNKTWQSQPLFFYNPYSRGLWWTGNPDFTVNYLTKPNSVLCPNLSNVSKNITSYVDKCKMCDIAKLTFGSGSEKYLANNDFNYIYDYWSNNALDIGFCSYNNPVQPNDLFTINAGIGNTANCDLWDPSNLIQTLSLNQADGYVITAPLNENTNQNYYANKLLYLSIKANFKNGEFITENKCITLNNTCNSITVQIRGNIKDYDPRIVNYEIKISE
jgi:hypothetical protein